MRSGGALGRLRERTSVQAAAMWAAASLLLAVTGERLSLADLDMQWQLLPLDALRDDPFGSVFDLHIQPPLWNLLVGVLARWSPFSLALSLQLVMIASGCLLAACIASIARTLGLGRAGALGLTALATLNGFVLLAATRPQYELPVAALLALLVWLASRPAGRRSPQLLLAGSAVITVLALTRSLYHPVVVPIVLLVIWRAHARHLDRRAVLGAAAIPLLLVGGWMLKNEVRFDHATMSSWSGMNLLRSVQPAIDPDDLEELADDGTISAVGAAPGTFGRLDDYAGAVPSCTPVHDGPTLTEPTRPVELRDDVPFPVDEIANFNAECFLPIYDAAQRDAIAIAKAMPDRWVLARLWSVNNWFVMEPLDSTSVVGDVVGRLTSIAFASVAHPDFASSTDDFWVSGASWTITIIAGSVLVVALGLRRGRRLWRGDVTPADVAIVLTAILLVWTFLTGVLFELGEQARFRAPTDPLVLVVAGAWAVGWYRRRFREKDTGTSTPAAWTNHQPRQSVMAASAAIVIGLGLVLVRQGEPPRHIVDAETAANQVAAATAALDAAQDTTTSEAARPRPTTSDAPSTVPSTASPATTPETSAPGTSAPTPRAEPREATSTVPPTTAVAAAAPTEPRCRMIAHLGDSNLGMAYGRFVEAYDGMGIKSVVDFSNGRGADIVKEGTTALEAIAGVRAMSSAEGRCWIIALSGADAVQSYLDGTDPRRSIRLIVDAIGDEPVMWIPPVLTSAETEWNLSASTPYDIALAEVVAGMPNVSILDWPSIALQHLDQFQIDGVHYSAWMYDLLVTTVLEGADARWEIAP